MEQCQIPGTDATVRLYRGNGGATTAFWYSVTFQGKGVPQERQVFYVDATPIIDSIRCHAEEVELRTSKAPIILSLEEIRDDLVHRPVGFRYGKPDKPAMQPFRTIGVILGLLFLGLAGAMGWSALERYTQR